MPVVLERQIRAFGDFAWDTHCRLLRESQESTLCSDAQQLVRVAIWVARMANDVVDATVRDTKTLFPTHPDDSALANSCKDGLTGISLAKRIIAELQGRGHRFDSLLELDEATLIVHLRALKIIS
jgi:hypothetical protein